MNSDKSLSETAPVKQSVLLYLGLKLPNPQPAVYAAEGTYCKCSESSDSKTIFIPFLWFKTK